MIKTKKYFFLYRYIYTCLVLYLTIAISGCTDPYAPKVVTPSASSIEILGYSAQNRPIECHRLGSGPETILILASIHGNESAGTPLVYKLIEHIQKDRRLLENRTILLIPVANPDGYALGTRDNINEVDLNRNFPASNRINITEYGLKPLSEPEAAALKEVIESNRPSRVISIHMPLKCIDYDGPGKPIAESMARVCDLPVTKLGAHPGSLGAYVGETLGIPIITLELHATDKGLSGQELWGKYGRALIAAIVYPRLLY